MNTADTLEIIELSARYCHAIDDLDAEAYVDLFTDDGEFYADGYLRGKGHAQLRANIIETARAARLTRRHWNCDHVVEVTGDTAQMRLYMMAFDVSRDLTPYLMGEYRDSLVRVDGRWLFRERRAEFCAGKVISFTPPSRTVDDEQAH